MINSQRVPPAKLVFGLLLSLGLDIAEKIIEANSLMENAMLDTFVNVIHGLSHGGRLFTEMGISRGRFC